MQHRRLQVVDVNAILNGTKTQFVGLTEAGAGPDAAAGWLPHGGIVVADDASFCPIEAER